MMSGVIISVAILWINNRLRRISNMLILLILKAAYFSWWRLIYLRAPVDDGDFGGGCHNNCAAQGFLT